MGFWREPDMRAGDEAILKGSKRMSPEEKRALFYRLLGVPEGERPNAYLILGLTPFEDDPDKIKDAAAEIIKMIQGLASASATHWIGHDQIRFIEDVRKKLLDMKWKKQHDDEIKLHIENETEEEYVLRITGNQNMKLPELRSLAELMSKKPDNGTRRALLAITASIATTVAAILTASQDRSSTNQASLVHGFNNKPPVATGGAGGGGDFMKETNEEPEAPAIQVNTPAPSVTQAAPPSGESEFDRLTVRHRVNRVITYEHEVEVEDMPAETAPVTVSTGNPVEADAFVFTDDIPDYLQSGSNAQKNTRLFERELERELAIAATKEVEVLEYSPALKTLEDLQLLYSPEVTQLMKQIIADCQRAIDEKKFLTAYTLIFRLSRHFQYKPIFEAQKPEMADQISVLIANYQAAEKPRWADNVDEAKLMMMDQTLLNPDEATPLMKQEIAEGQRAIDEKKFHTAYTLIFRVSRRFQYVPIPETQKEEVQGLINELITNYQAAELPRWAKDVEEAKLMMED